MAIDGHGHRQCNILTEGLRGRAAEGPRSRRAEEPRGPRGRVVRGAEGPRGRGAEWPRGRGAEGQRGRGAEGQRGRGPRTPCYQQTTRQASDYTTSIRLQDKHQMTRQSRTQVSLEKVAAFKKTRQAKNPIPRLASYSKGRTPTNKVLGIRFAWWANVSHIM